MEQVICIKSEMSQSCQDMLVMEQVICINPVTVITNAGLYSGFLDPFLA